METKRIMFVDDCNGYEYDSPIATIVEIPVEITIEMLKFLENQQPGIGHAGGNYIWMLRKGQIEFVILAEGRQKNFKKGQDYDEEYRVVSGNY